MREVLAAALIRGSAARKPKRSCQSFDFTDLSLQQTPGAFDRSPRHAGAAFP